MHQWAGRTLLTGFRLTPDDPPPPRSPGVRQVTGLIKRNPDRIRGEDQRKLKEILARCPELDAATGHLASSSLSHVVTIQPTV